MATAAELRKLERERKKTEREAERAAMDAAAVQRLAEEKAAAEDRVQREARKKQRDEERKQEEEAAKAQRKEGATNAGDNASKTVDAEMEDSARPEGPGEMEVEEEPRDPIYEMHSGGMAGGEDEAGVTDEGADQRSLVKKKKKKDKKKKEKPAGEESILKQGRFSKEGIAAMKQKQDAEKTAAEVAAEAARVKLQEATKKREEQKSHKHVYKRTVVECSVICSSEDITQRYNEYPAAVRLLLKNLQKVDKWACLEPVDELEDYKIWEAEKIPYDHTDLGNWCVFSGNAGSFEKRKAKKNKNNSQQSVDDDDDLVFPEVYFVLAFSSDKDPYKMLERVSGDWGKCGGVKLYIKDIASFETRTAINIFHLRNDNSFDTILSELRKILLEAKDRAELEDHYGIEEYLLKDLPSLSIRKQMPKIFGQDTSVFQGWSNRQHDMRKTLHVETEEEGVNMIQFLSEKAKSMSLFQDLWGSMVKVTLVIDSKKKKKGQKQTQQHIDMAAIASYNRKHINYHSSTRMDGIRGILDLDKPVAFYSVTDATKVVGFMTLRRLLYKYVKMQDGHMFFQEVHQAEAMGAVDVVIPYCEEAERMMGMIHRNAAAYFLYYCRDNAEIPTKVVEDVIRASMDPTLVNGAKDCKWDKENWVLTTPADEESEKLKALEDAAWYNDEFGEHMVDTTRKEKGKFASKEALEELNCDHSHATVHKKKGNYNGSPGAPAFQPGSDKKPIEIDINDGNAGEAIDEDLANLSHAELIALLKAQNLAAKTVGSPPNSEALGSGRGAEDAESVDSSSGDSSGGSSSDDGHADASVEGPLLLVMEATPRPANRATVNSPPSWSL